MRCDYAHNCTWPCGGAAHHPPYDYDDDGYKYEHDPADGYDYNEYYEHYKHECYYVCNGGYKHEYHHGWDPDDYVDDGYNYDEAPDEPELPELSPTLAAIRHALLTRPTRRTDLLFRVRQEWGGVSADSRYGFIKISGTYKGVIYLRAVVPLRSRAQARGAESLTVFGGVLCTRFSTVLDLADPGSLARLDAALALFDAAIE